MSEIMRFWSESLENLHTSVSDHIPVLCQIQYRLDKVDSPD